jgi:hypothetical protein
MAGTHFTLGKIKIPMKILEFKRPGIGLIAEFRGIPNGFPNLGLHLNGLCHLSIYLRKTKSYAS